MVVAHARNVEGMVQHRKNMHADAIRRTETTLDTLERSGSVINFQLVARRAGVSRSWLYKQQAIRDRIAALRRDHPWPAHAPAERASDTSKEAVIRTLRQRLADERTARTKLLDENMQLRKINEVLAGQVYHCRTYHTTNAGHGEQLHPNRIPRTPKLSWLTGDGGLAATFRCRFLQPRGPTLRTCARRDLQLGRADGAQDKR